MGAAMRAGEGHRALPKRFDNFFLRGIGGTMPTNALRHIAAWAALGSLLAGAGCARQGGDTAAQAAPQAAPGERTFALSGEVLKVDPKAKVLTVRHNEVAGYMPAMTMEFPVSAGDAAVARPGERIRADLVVDSAAARSASRTSGRTTRSRSTRSTPGPACCARTRSRRAAGAFREVGEKAPDFVLYDQDGRVVEQRPLPREAGHAELHLLALPGRQHVPALDDEDDGDAEAREGGRHRRHRVRLDHARPRPRHAGRPAASTPTTAGSTPRTSRS